MCFYIYSVWLGYAGGAIVFSVEAFRQSFIKKPVKMRDIVKIVIIIIHLSAVDPGKHMYFCSLTDQSHLCTLGDSTQLNRDQKINKPEKE